jgi:transmembrane sensor
VEEAIIRHLQGRASASEVAALERWRRSAPENEVRYAELARLWAVTGAAEPAAIASVSPSAAELLGGARRGAATQGTAAARRRSRGIAVALAAAALIVLALGITWPRSGAPEGDLFAASEFTTGPAERVTATLRDGSVVRLAPNSRLRVVASAEAREVWLDGKAYFAVATQAGRPFIVRTRAGDALVLGTRFEVKVEETELRVVVVEGRVALSAAEETVEVGAGEVSQVVAGRAPSLERIEDVTPELEWLGNFLVFQDTPLTEVAREIEQQYGVRVLLPDREVAERTVTASFTDRSVEEVLMVVCRVVDAHCSLRGTVASIEP